MGGVPLHVIEFEHLHVVEDLFVVGPAEDHQVVHDDVGGVTVPGRWRETRSLNIPPFEIVFFDLELPQNIAINTK